jgi:hypothetical protein
VEPGVTFPLPVVRPGSGKGDDRVQKAALKTTPASAPPISGPTTGIHE